MQHYPAAQRGRPNGIYFTALGRLDIGAKGLGLVGPKSVLDFFKFPLLLGLEGHLNCFLLILEQIFRLSGTKSVLSYLWEKTFRPIWSL